MIASAREKIAKLVKRACEHTIGCVKRFFDTVAVMYVDVNVQDTRVKPNNKHGQIKNVRFNTTGKCVGPTKISYRLCAKIFSVGDRSRT